MIKKPINKFEKTPRTVFSFKQAVELVGMPYATFRQGKKAFNFLLDTGSSDNVIDSNIINKIKHAKVATDYFLSGLEGNKKLVGTCHIDLEYEGNTYEDNFLISDMKGIFSTIKEDTGVTMHGILGVNFFNNYKYILDFENLAAYSKP